MKEREIFDLIDSKIPCGMLVLETDEDFTIVYANKGYYELVGYSEQEHLEQFHGKGILILHPDEAERVILSYQDQTYFSDMFSVKAKLAHKTRGYIWAHFNGRVFTSPDGARKICMVVMDISEYLFTNEQREHEYEYIELMLALSEDVFFDYDVPNGIISFSDNFASRFGIPASLENFPQSFIDMGFVADESLHAFQYGGVDLGEGMRKNEVHLKLPSGGDIWYTIYFKVAFDATGSPSRSVGKMIDITKEKLHIAELTSRAQNDPLTKLYNKEESRLRIDRYLNGRQNDEKAVLMLIDIDNFKGVNDTLGHQFGDKVLVDVSRKLKKVFRESDVVGRVGGDEFIVFMGNIKLLSLIKEKARAITDAFRHTFSGENDTYKISGSVGVTLCPEHGTCFEDLYHRADIALYKSKHRGKDRYTIYATEMKDGE